MDGPKIWRGHATLSAPLKLMGVERGWFLLSATVALALWNAINSLLIGGMIFGVLYTAGLLAWRKDPAMLSILKVSVSFRTRYDPGKWSNSPWVVRDPRMNLSRRSQRFRGGRIPGRRASLLGLAPRWRVPAWPQRQPHCRCRPAHSRSRWTAERLPTWTV